MHLTLHLTSRCNMRCRYCYAGPPGSADMTADTMRRAIAVVLERHQAEHPGDSLGVIFFGGEPLLRRGLIAETVRHCRQIEAETGQLFHFKITTNGLLLDEEFLTGPDTADIFVALSHDGLAHDAHRVDAAGRGTADRLAPTIRLLLEHKPYAPVMLVVNPDTVPLYADSVAWLFEQGFRYLICSLNYGATWNRRQVAELRRQYERLAEWYYRQTRAEEKFYLSPFEVKIASHVYPESCCRERCELGQRQISVAPDGRLYPCVQFAGDPEFAIGDVEGGIDESARQRLYALNDEEKPTCAECALRDRCNHYCGCLNRQATGRLDTVSPLLCAHERTILPIADRLAARLYKARDPLFIQKHYNELYPLISLVEDTVARRGAG